MRPGSKIAWEFRLEKKDIGLSANFQRWETEGQSEPTKETVIEYSKIFAEHGAVTGSFRPEGQFAKGVITFAWDNSFSKMCVAGQACCALAAAMWCCAVSKCAVAHLPIVSTA